MNNKKVLVTGASRGIGLEIAKKLYELEYELILTCSSAESLSTLQQKEFVNSGRVSIKVVDQSDYKSVESFCNSFDGQLWGIVNNAGICKTLALKEPGEDSFMDVLNTNLIGPYYLVKLLLPKISRPGRIVNIASQLGHEGRAGYSAYSASKFGLIGMTKCWAKELGAEGITVNAVSPGWVDTKMSRLDMSRMAKEAGITIENYYKRICEPLELKRFNSTEEVANLVAYLLSEESSGVTGRDWLMQTIWNQL